MRTATPQGSAAPAAARDEPDEDLREGFRAVNEHRHADARPRFDRALARGIASGDTRVQAEAHRGIGLVLLNAADYPPAREQFETAIAGFDDLGDALGGAFARKHLASLFRMTGDAARAMALFRDALAVFEQLGLVSDQAATLYAMGLTSSTPDGAERQQVLARGLALAIEAGDSKLQGQILHGQGDHLFATGDFAAALDKYEQALALLEQSRARSELARVYVSLGRLQRAHGHADRAEQLYRKALAIQEELGDRQGAIQSVNAIAVALGIQGRAQESLDEYQKALAMARATGSPRIVLFILGNLSSAYLALGDAARAAELFEQVIRENVDPSQLGGRYTQLAEAYSVLGRYDAALDAANKGIELMRDKGGDESIFVAYHRRARINQKLGKIDDALADARAALQAVEDLRAKVVPSDFMKRGFADWHQSLFTFGIDLHHDLGRPREALAIAERGRARAFVDLLSVREQTSTGGLTLRGGGASALAPASGDPELDSPFVVSLAQDNLETTARRLGSTLLLFWVADQSTIVGVVKPDGETHTERIPVTSARLAELVRATWPAVGRPQRPAALSAQKTMSMRGGGEPFDPFASSTESAASRELHDLLIRPIASWLPPADGSRLTIVPHGPLLLLSFAGLRDKRGRYLIEDYTLHYVPAIAALNVAEPKSRAAARERGEYLLVGNPRQLPALPDGTPLPRLPASEKEVSAIARTRTPGSVTVLTGLQADERHVRESASGKAVIHLATHGVVRDDSPFESYLALGAGAGGADNDGRLTASEIYGLSLDADLVVLSACRTGSGRVSGDGIIGLTRSFLSAGAASVVAPLWDVADETASLMLPMFYRARDRGEDKDRALRSAQLQMLAALRSGSVKVNTAAGPMTLPESPMFWASFVLVGQP